MPWTSDHPRVLGGGYATGYCDAGNTRNWRRQSTRRMQRDTIAVAAVYLGIVSMQIAGTEFEWGGVEGGMNISVTQLRWLNLVRLSLFS